jgi:hypothetical protein
METIETFLGELRQKADQLPVRFRDPLSEGEIAAHAGAFVETFGVPLPDEYLALLRVTDGLPAGVGDIDSFETMLEQDREVWFDHHLTNDAGIWQGIACKRPTYIWLGYEGNSAEQVFDLITGEYQQVALGGRQPVYRGTLVGLLRHLIYGQTAAG